MRDVFKDDIAYFIMLEHEVTIFHISHGGVV
jgi:hypothetical protein